MDLSDEGLRENAKALQVLMRAQVPLPKEPVDIAYEALRSVRDAAREQALEEAARLVNTSTIDLMDSAAKCVMIGKAVTAIHRLKDRPTDAATTPARPAAAPASSPEPTDPAGRAS